MMKNPFDLFRKKSESEDTFLGLLLKEGDGVLFYINQDSGGDLRIIKKEKFDYSNGWERLAEDVDEVLNKLETTTGKSPEKTIFFIYSHLVDPITKEIQRSYLQKIKQLVKNLELKPLGFIECHEALLDYLQQKEKMPLTANLIEFDKTALGIFVYTTGRLIFSDTVARTNNVIADLLPVFEKIKLQSVLPPRIILYDSKDLDLESTSILTHQWGKDFFIQLPKVQIFKEDQVIDSFLSIFSSQMKAGGRPAVSMQESSGKPEKQEVMGFVIGDDVAEKSIAQADEEEITPPSELKQPGRSSGLIPMGAFGKFFLSVKKKTLNLYQKTKSLPFPVLPVIGALLIVVALFSIEYFFHKAKVRVFLPSQEITKSTELKAVVGGKGGSDTLVLKVATETAKLNDSKTATGNKAVGESAKGTVTVLNYDSSPTTFDQGTTIQAQGLKFALDENITVASASVAPDLSLQPGKSNSSVVAQEIGTESNLSKDQKFQIADFPQNRYLATNENAFTGGNRSSVQTVSAEDIIDVEGRILAKAKSFTDKQLKSKLPKENVLIEQLTTYDLGDITYSNEVGDEVGSIEGKTEAEITHFSYRLDNLLKIVDKLLASDVKPGFQINHKAGNYKITQVDEQPDNYLLTIDIKAKAVEDIKTDDLLVKLKGKTSGGLQSLVKDQYHAEGVELEVRHPIPWFKNLLPFFIKNIDLEISYL